MVVRRTAVVIAGAVMGLVGAGLIGATQANAATTTDTLTAGGKLTAGQSLVSQTGQQQVIMQTDGNFVIYSNGGATWSTRTSGSGNYATLQTDGNLVVYSSGNTALWSSRAKATNARLIMQADGNLVEYTGSKAVWNTSTSADTLFAGGKLTAGQAIWSQDHVTEALMQTDGNFVVYSHGGASWSTLTRGTGSFATLQTDGNLVVYSSDNKPVWNSGTRGTGSSQLIMQSDGNLALYGNGASTWSSQTSTSKLTPNGRLTAGQSMHSVSGAYELAMQTDGNLVLYGKSGALWYSSTTGANNYAIVQFDGNFVVYSSAGKALWSTLTSSQGDTLVLQDDGNLVIYPASGAAVWSSGTRQSGVPGGVTTAPPATISHYVRNLTGGSGDAGIMNSIGASDARGLAGGNYLILLDIGGQTSSGGVILTGGTGATLSDAQLVTAVNGYVDGFHQNQASGVNLVLAIGTNNDGSVSQTTGTDWAVKVINQITTHANGTGIEIAGANDIEPGFSAGPTDTTSWLTGFLGSTGARFVNNGSADGCSTGSPGASCNNGWTAQDLYNLSAGLAPSRIITLPQIYNGAQGQQWPQISLTGTQQGKAPITFAGPLTEVGACSSGGCSSYNANTAWNVLYQDLQSAGLAPNTLPYATDLRSN